MASAGRGAIAPTSMESDGVCLSSYCPADSADLLAAVRESITSVGHWLPWCHAEYGEADAREWIEHCREAWLNGDEFAFAVRDRGTSEFLGGVGLNQFNRQRQSANLGYWVRQTRQGRGVASVCARLAARFGFEKLRLKRIEIIAHPDNAASQRVADKLGAVFEGKVPDRMRLHGKPVDAMMYALHAPTGLAG